MTDLKDFNIPTERTNFKCSWTYCPLPMCFKKRFNDFYINVNSIQARYRPEDKYKRSCFCLLNIDDMALNYIKKVYLGGMKWKYALHDTKNKRLFLSFSKSVPCLKFWETVSEVNPNLEFKVIDFSCNLTTFKPHDNFQKVKQDLIEHTEDLKKRWAQAYARFSPKPHIHDFSVPVQYGYHRGDGDIVDISPIVIMNKDSKTLKKFKSSFYFPLYALPPNSREALKDDGCMIIDLDANIDYLDFYKMVYGDNVQQSFGQKTGNLLSEATRSSVCLEKTKVEFPHDTKFIIIEDDDYYDVKRESLGHFGSSRILDNNRTPNTSVFYKDIKRVKRNDFLESPASYNDIDDQSLNYMEGFEFEEEMSEEIFRHRYSKELELLAIICAGKSNVARCKQALGETSYEAEKKIFLATLLERYYMHVEKFIEEQNQKYMKNWIKHKYSLNRSESKNQMQPPKVYDIQE